MFAIEAAPARSRRRTSLSAALMVLATALPAFGQRPVDIHVFRFWRPPDLTLVETFTTVPLSLLKFTKTADSAQSQALISGKLEVRDSASLVIFTQPWQDTIRVPAMSEASYARSDASQHFAFQLKPGRYTINLTVAEPGTTNTWKAEETIIAFAGTPLSSDLVLASDLSRLTDESATPNAIVRGSLAVFPNFTGALTSEKARVALYTEVYRPGMPAESSHVQIEVAGKGTDFKYVTPPQPRVYPGGIGSEAFALNLTGLPPGDYALQMRIGMKRDTVTLSHPLQMMPPGSGVVQAAETTLFDGKTEEQLDSLFAPMRYIATIGEAENYDALSGPEPKRRWLNQFWQRRAASENVSANALLNEWLDRLQYVNRDFAPTQKGQANRKGWQTDRGRIYMKFGPPVERQTAGQSRTGAFHGCERWQYTSGRGDRYIFIDRSGFRDYELVFSTDRDEPGVPGFAPVVGSPNFSCSESGR
jgi:GWxTD domain-containing protein